MAPTRRRGSKVSTAIARKEWDVGDLVMAKVKGFPPWPAQVSRAEEFNLTPNPSRVFVYFFGTRQIRFCQHTEISDFTPEVRAALTTKCQSKGTIADLRLAVMEICEADDESRSAQCKQNCNISCKEDDNLHFLQFSSEKKELQQHLEIDDESGLKENNIEEVFAPIYDPVKDRPGVGSLDGVGTNVVDGGKSCKKWKEGKRGNILKVIEREAEGMKCDLMAGSVKKNDNQNVSGGRTIAEVSKCEEGVTDLGSMSSQNAQTLSHEGNEETIDLEKGDFEPLEQTGSQKSYGVKEPAKDHVDTTVGNLPNCLEKVEKHSPISINAEHAGQQEVMKSTEFSTGLLVGNLPTSFALGGLEVDDSEYANSDHKLAQEGTRAHQVLQQRQEAGNSLDFCISNQLKHKGNDQKSKMSRETSSVHGKSQHITDKQETVHASPTFKHDEGTELERRKIEDSGIVESHTCNEKEQSVYSNAKHDAIKKDKASVKRRKLVDSKVKVKMQLTMAYKEAKLAGDTSTATVSEKLKKAVRDSDEHLPLVKRARSRGHVEYLKLATDDQSPILSQKRQTEQGEELIDFAKKVKTKRNVPLNAYAVSTEQQLQRFEVRNLKRNTPFNADAGFAKQRLQRFDEREKGIIPLKAEKHRLRSTLLDGEASLPPSKRRERVLEAMTACVAEAASIGTGKVKHPAATAHIASKSISAHNVSESVSVFSPLPRHTTAGIQQNKDEVGAERSGSVSILKTESVFVHDHVGFVTESMPVSGEGSIMDHAILNVQERGNASEVCSPVPEGKTKGRNQNALITNDIRTNFSSRHDSGLESTLTLKVSEVPSRECAATSAPQSLIASMQPTKTFSSVSQETGRNYRGSQNSQLEEDKNIRQAYEVAKEIKQRMCLKEKDSSQMSTSMKFLIAAAQAKRVIRPQGAAESVPLESERLPIFLASSPSFRYERGNFRMHSPMQQCPAQPLAEALPTNQSGACSERYKVHVSGDKCEDFQTGNMSSECGDDSLQKACLHEEQEAGIARDALEGMLETLSRTKDSIGRVTRHALDCAKFGIAKQIVEVIVRKLEDEHSFRRRVDLFFLLDSITQCAVKDKGVAEATYPPAVQAALPRLLKAAAPPGNNARENRRQCLKVRRDL